MGGQENDNCRDSIYFGYSRIIDLDNMGSMEVMEMSIFIVEYSRIAGEKGQRKYTDMAVNAETLEEASEKVKNYFPNDRPIINNVKKYIKDGIFRKEKSTFLD